VLSTFDQNFQKLRDVEQAALELLDSRLKMGGKPIGEAEYHCQGYAGEGNPPHDVIIGCRVSITDNGKLRWGFKLNGKRIACHKITLRLGELGV